MAMDWDRLRIFHAVADAGSFTHAGEGLGLSQSAVSRQISALEDSLNVTLFHRHARGLLLTEQGELLHKTVRDVFGKLAMVEARLADTKDRPEGSLKVTTTTAFGSLWLTPRLKEFKQLYPEIDLTVILGDDELDLSMREADVAIRFRPPKQPDLVQRQIGVLSYAAYASAPYIEAHGMPRSIQDLDHHGIVVFGEGIQSPVDNMNWLLDVGKPPSERREPILRVNSSYGIFRAVSSGMGVGSIATYMVRESENLVRVLPELEGPSHEVYFVYPGEMRQSKRVTVFRDFLLQHIGKEPL